MEASATAVWPQGKVCGWSDMIFVTVGNDFRGFDRLLKRMDEIAPLIPNEMLMQSGFSGYLPRNTKYFDFVPMDRAIEYIQESELVVSHAGIGTIILCKEYGTPILIFPRRKGYGEHINDHQMEIAKALEERRDETVHVVYREDQLQGRILRILREGRRYSSIENTAKANLIRTIKTFINFSQT